MSEWDIDKEVKKYTDQDIKKIDYLNKKISVGRKNNTFLLEFKRSKSGIAGICILLFLISMIVYAFLAVPFDSYKEWNNPNFWIDNPRTAAPIWSSIGSFGAKTLEHIILSSTDENRNIYPNQVTISNVTENNIEISTHSYKINYNSDFSPDDFMITYSISNTDIPPAIEIEVIRPDNNAFNIYFDTTTSSVSGSLGDDFMGRIFSTDNQIHQRLTNYLPLFDYEQDPSKPEIMIFANKEIKSILKGDYTVNIKFYLFNNTDQVFDSKLILGGDRYGLIGTDEMRRDLAIGLMWGAPIALFIGLSVSSVSILIGLFYGVVAGYKGKRVDEGLMRINDIFYSLPTLPILIILSVIFGRNIFLIVLFLIIFGWIGTAKISRSLALQIKNFQYVEAAKLLGQSDIKIIFKHIIPQLLPLTFASIAISVPGAILAEASLSFIGLGDPSIPTWGQILHEAHSAAAASRGLWWWLVPPGMMIALTGLAFVLIGNAMESILNPRMKKQ